MPRSSPGHYRVRLVAAYRLLFLIYSGSLPLTWTRCSVARSILRFLDNFAILLFTFDFRHRFHNAHFAVFTPLLSCSPLERPVWLQITLRWSPWSPISHPRGGLSPRRKRSRAIIYYWAALSIFYHLYSCFWSASFICRLNATIRVPERTQEKMFALCSRDLGP